MRAELGRLTGKHRRLLLLAFGLAAATLLLLLALAFRDRSSAGGPDRRTAMGTAAPAAAQIVLLEEPGGGRELRWIPSRPRRERWTTEEIERFWFDPDSMGLEYLERTIEERLRRLVAEVP